MAFKHDYIEIMKKLSMLVDIMIYLDIIMMFFTSYTDERGDLIDDYRLIAMRYIHSWLFLDFLVVLPFESLVDWTGVFDGYG